MVVVIGAALFWQYDRKSESPTSVPAQISLGGLDDLEKVKILSAVESGNPEIIIIQGEAPGTWFFEANIVVDVEDVWGNKFVTSGGQAQGEWMTVEQVSFKAELKADLPESGEGYIVVRNDNPSGLPKNEKFAKFPVKFPLQ